MHTVGLLDQLDDLLLPPLEHLLDLGPRDDRERRNRLRPFGRCDWGSGKSCHDAPSCAWVSRSNTLRGSAMPTRISRGPSYASRLWAMRTLSTSMRSPISQGVRRVWSS